MNRRGLRTWIEVDKRAIENNIAVFRKLIGRKVKLMAVVKSNAYGHSLHDFCRFVERRVGWFGVDSVMEGLALRAIGIKKPVLVLGYTLPEMIEEAERKNLSLTISSPDHIKFYKNKKVKVHIKIDTGMHRQGFTLAGVTKFKDLNIEGIYTHFSSAKNPAFPTETNKQMLEFEKACKFLGEKVVRHAAATSGTIVFPNSHYDMVRVGIGLYGLWPSREVEAGYSDKLKLKPALSWKTIVGEIKNLNTDDGVGYDLTEKVTRKTKIAILPVGYWHGYPRVLSGIGHVVIRGQRCKILGRISMDMIVADVTRVKNVKVGDEVALINDKAPASELATLSGTINYEIITRLNPLVKRFFI